MTEKRMRLLLDGPMQASAALDAVMSGDDGDDKETRAAAEQLHSRVSGLVTAAATLKVTK